MAGMKDGDFGALDHKLPPVTVANVTIVGTLEALLSCNDPEYPSYTDGGMRFVRRSEEQGAAGLMCFLLRRLRRQRIAGPYLALPLVVADTWN